MNIEPYDIPNVTCTRQTNSALLCIIGQHEVWVPKSVVLDESEVFDCDENSEGKLIVAAWWAETKEREGVL